MRVREVIKLIEDDGWVMVRQTGSHRAFRHPVKPGTTTVAGNLGKEVKPGTLASILRQAGLRRPR
jgi:predicted RNA binding protein YcfA (HicA-like mRNA interferase family)